MRLRPAVCPPGALCLASSAGDGAGTAVVWPFRQRLSVGPARPSKEQLRPPAFVRSASLWPGSFVPVIAAGERFALSCLPLRCALPAPVPSAVEPSCLAALLPRGPSCFAWRPPGRAGGLADSMGLGRLRSTAASRSLPLLRLTCSSLWLSGELLAVAAVRPVGPAPLRSPARRAGRLWLVRFSPERPSLAVRLRGGSLFRFLRPSAPGCAFAPGRVAEVCSVASLALRAGFVVRVLVLHPLWGRTRTLSPSPCGRPPGTPLSCGSEAPRLRLGAAGLRQPPFAPSLPHRSLVPFGSRGLGLGSCRFACPVLRFGFFRHVPRWRRKPPVACGWLVACRSLARTGTLHGSRRCPFGCPAFARSSSLWPVSYVPIIAAGERCALNCSPPTGLSARPLLRPPRLHRPACGYPFCCFAPRACGAVPSAGVAYCGP